MTEGENLPGDALPEELIAQPAEEIEAEAATAEEVEEQEAQGDDKPKAKGVQKRIDELTANWREEQRTRQKLEQMLERMLPDKQQPAPVQAQPQPKGEPTLDQFSTYEEYVGALADHKADARINAWQQEQKAQQEAQQRASVQSEFQRHVESFKADTPDFDLVAFNPSLPISDAMAEAIQSSDAGPQVLYFLGKNPAEAARIAGLPPVQAARELGKLEVNISLPQPKKQSSAPPPIQPLSGGSGSPNVDPEKMTDAEWVAWRNQSLRR